MPIPLLRPLPLLLAASLLACAGQTPPPNTEEAPVGPLSRAKLVDKVFDARGQSRTCEPPPADCPSVSPDRDLADRCSLGGFRMIQCGCDMLCTGDPTAGAAKQHYDAEGHGKPCAPATADCTPPSASAAFQDACSEKGHKLEVCGCEWLCSGNPAP